MDSDIRLYACRLSIHLVKSSGDTKVPHKSAALDGIDSSINCLHIVGDKTLTSLSAGSFQFYALHVVKLHFLESERGQLDMTGDTISACLRAEHGGFHSS